MSRGGWYKKLAEKKGYEYALDMALEQLQEMDDYMSAHFTMEKLMGALERRRQAHHDAQILMEKALTRLRSKE